jgi:ribosome maturation factor RimP
MIDCKKITEIAEQQLAGTDMFVVECTCSPSNEVELLIDSDSSVSIDACVALNRAIDAEFDRDVEDYSLTVASAGIGEPLLALRQYHKLVGSTVEVLLKSGVKILATLDEVTEEAITISYEEAVVVEGKKKKQLQRTSHTYSFDEIKWTKEYLDYK